MTTIADLNLDGLFTGINGMFGIFSGIIGGVENQSGNIGQLVAIAIILTAVLGIVAGLFIVFKKAVGGWNIYGK